MSITVIIVNWNCGALPADCLLRIERQTVQPKRVLVVENTSSDDSVNSAEALAYITVLTMGASIVKEGDSLHGKKCRPVFQSGELQDSADFKRYLSAYDHGLC